MGNAIRYLSLVLLVTAFVPFSTGASAKTNENKEGILVGRIAHVEGKLLRYIEEEKDWVVTVKDAPFGLEDALYSEEDARAEFTMPNRTWLRVGENTQIQLIDLSPDATTVDVGSGLVRMYNRSENTVIKTMTPYGYVVASGNTVFDLYVGDETLEVIAIRGNVDFIHERSDARYEVRSGSFSIIADHTETAKGNGTVDSVWDDWNGERDSLWNERLQSRSYSAQFVPEPLRDEAHVLDETGRWERVYYEGGYRDMWRPMRVERGWRPFTAGRWVVYYGDNCWIPDEPFGYITHHYGSWIYVETRRSWYWAPPVTRVVAGTPRVSIGFGWYPGRVGWIHRDTYVGWVPLAPHETYYCYRPWGGHSVVVNPAVSVNVGINFNLASFFFVNHAVVVHRDYFFSGRRYTPYIERNIGRNVIINNYQPVTVINNTVINNYSTNFNRFAASDAVVFKKPHGSVVDRIVVNQKIKSEFGSMGKDRIIKDVTRVRSLAEPSTKKESHKLTVASKLVDPDKAHKPLDALSAGKKEIKGRERQVADSKFGMHGADSEKGNKDVRSKGEGKRAGELSLQQHGRNGGKELKSQGRQDGDSKQGRKEKTVERDGGAGKNSASEQTMRSQKKDRQEGLQQEQKSASSGGKGRKNQDQSAVERGGVKKNSREEIRRAQEPRDSGKKMREQSDRRQDQVRQVERKNPRKEQQVQYQQQDQPQRQKGSGKQGRQEEDQVAQEQFGKKGGGKKNE